jgi:hypothetical protein
VTVHDVLSAYESRLDTIQAGIAEARLHHTAAACVLAVAAILVLTLGLYALRKQVSFWWPSAPVPVAAAAARLYGRYRRAGARLWRLQRFYQRAVRRVRGDWRGQGSTGAEFIDPGHVYAQDLNVLGDASLFELLSTVRSGVGKHGLAKYLLDASTPEETLLRQQAVRELRDRTDLREAVAALGPHEFSESSWETFTEWLDSPRVRFHGAARFVFPVTAVLSVLLLLAGWVQLVPWTALAVGLIPLLGFQCAAGLVMRHRVNGIVAAVRVLSAETQVIREGMEMLERERFRSTKLSALTAGVRNGADSVRRLERLLGALSERNKEYFYLPSLVLMLGSQVSMAIERWRAEHGPALRAWLEAWAEFEALNALAGYAYENPDNTFPDFARDGACFEARALGHPLLARETCVRNDVVLNDAARFYLVSGSNMSGKSTLLRTMGLNAVLAMAGAPVRAAALRMSHLTVCASLAVVDSLASGKSKFLAEVDRLREAIGLAGGKYSVLFLIDEIFSGTNSPDRRVAAEAVVRTLVERGAIGALSTHDLALSEIAANGSLRGRNVHMGSKDGSDPMDFDYRLKSGVTRETNALAIARMAGVPV